MQKKLSIRFANISDLPSIVDIYNQAIRSKSATGDMDEFSVENRIKWFNKFDTDRYPIYVAEQNNTVVGYATLSPYREGRQAMSRIAEISFFLDYSYRGLGIGSSILEYVMSDCKRLRKEILLAILLDINTESIYLLKKFKFQEWGRLPKVIDFNGEICDHLIYGLDLKSIKEL